MSEPAKSVLSDKLWGQLSSNADSFQHLKNSLLFSSPQDAVKWLLVSKDIKEFIEENRDKMRLFKRRDFEFEKNDCSYLTLRHGDPALPTKYVDCIPTRGLLPALDSFHLTPLTPNIMGHQKWRLVYTSPFGLARFVKLVLQWFEFERAYFRWGSVDFVVLSSLAEDDISLCLYGVYDNALADAIESLRIKNIVFGSRQEDYPETFLRRLHDLPLEKVCVRDTTLLKHLDCPSILLVEEFLSIEKFMDLIVIPWYIGKRPRLELLTFNLDGRFKHRLFKPVDYVPTASEVKCERRVYFYEDRKGEHFMQVNADRVRIVPFMPTFYPYVSVEVRIFE